MADKEKTPAADDNKIDHYVKMGTIAMGKHAMVLEVQEENTTNRFAMKLLLPEAMKESEQIQILNRWCAQHSQARTEITPGRTVDRDCGVVDVE